jgi:hypothetical protein
MVDATRGCAVDAERGELPTFGGGTVLIKAATPAITVWEEREPLLDTPLHVHEREDELFQIWRGSTSSSAAATGSRSGRGTFSRCRAECRMRIGAS